MRNLCLMVLLLCLVCLMVGARVSEAAYESRNSGLDALFSACDQDVPSISVAVLKFDGPSRRASELARGSILLNLRRHGLQIRPEAETLAAAVAQTDAALVGTPMVEGTEPGGEGITRMVAARIGEELGVDWVVYGQINELRADTRVSFFRTRRLAMIDFQINFVKAGSGETLYWARAKDRGSCGVGIANAKGTSLERRITIRTTNHVFTHLTQALPEHKVGPEVTEKDVQSFIEQMGL